MKQSFYDERVKAILHGDENVEAPRLDPKRKALGIRLGFSADDIDRLFLDGPRPKVLVLGEFPLMTTDEIAAQERER